MSFKSFIKEVICSLKCNGKLQTSNQGELLAEKLAMKMDESGIPVLLWENPNPTQAIDINTGITIGVDASQYRFVQMLFRRADTDSQIFSGYMRKGDDKLCAAYVMSISGDDEKNEVISAVAHADYADGRFSYWGTTIRTLSITSNGVAVLSSRFTGDMMIPQAVIGYR